METAGQSDRPRRRRFLQFGLRALIALVVLAAVSTFWLRQKVENARNERLAVEALRESGTEVRYPYEFDPKTRFWQPNATRPDPDWLEDLLGENLFEHPQHVTLLNWRVGDDETAAIQYLQGLSGVSCLVPTNVPLEQRIGDRTVAHIAKMEQLHSLALTNANVTDAGLVQLGNLTELRRLVLSGTQVTDEGMSALVAMRSMTMLSLERLPAVTDKGILYLEGMNELETLNANGTGITGPGFKYLCGKQSLELIDLQDSDFGDEGMQYFQEMPALHTLRLENTSVSDAGLAQLGAMPSLVNLTLKGTNVTDAG